MTYRLPGGRVELDLDGPLVEVESLRSFAIQRLSLREWQAYDSAQSPEGELVALIALFRRFVAEAQPTWDIADHLGPIDASASGMLRLPVPLALGIVALWLETIVPVASELPASAVDAVIEPGPFRDAVKRRLRAVKKAA